MSVKNVSEIRRENMEALFERYKDWVWTRFPKHPERGMITQFANAIQDRAGSKPTDRPAAYLSHIRNGRKEVGHDLARRIESGMRALGHEFADVVDGWMDNDHSSPKPMRYKEISLHDALEICFDTNPIETQRAMNELMSRLLIEQVAKQ